MTVAEAQPQAVSEEKGTVKITVCRSLSGIAEGAEDGALGDACGLGDLAGGQPVAVLDEQRADSLYDPRAPFIGPERTGAATL